MSYRPLADEIRPQSLDEVVGQRHILGENGLLRRIIESGHIPNLVFYGPSGTGKTTVANIIARRTNRPLHRLNATTASISDIKDIIKDIGTMLAPDGVLLYLDEIQYFNKKQQQSLLEFMENGKITLIASTTENPYFYVYNAVLSRSTVFEFKPIEAVDVLPAIDRGIRLMGERLGAEVDCEDGVREHIATACGGDVRKSMNAVELLLSSARREGERLVVTLADAQTVAQRSAMRYDREGDDHYDIASALMKSMRGSDPDAALHYLARLLEAGDMTTAIRRILCSASEDVGMAYPQAAQKAESSRPVLTKRHYQKLIRHQILCRQDANPYSHDCFEHIGQDNHKGQRPAEGAVEVGQPGIAAAMGTHIVPQDILGDDDRPVEAAAEVGDHCDQQGRKQQGRPQLTQCGGKVRLYSRGNCCRICHDYPSLSLFCRMVSRTGVPSRPKVERIWFSR